MNLAPSFRGAGEACEPGIRPAIPSRWIPDSQASPGFRNDGEVVIRIRRAGVVAAEFCNTSGDAEVAAVFERSFYLRADDLFVCVGEPAIGNGPLTLLADMRVPMLGLRPGQPARIAGNRIDIGAVTFTCEGWERWHPPAWPRAAAPAVLARVRDDVMRRAAMDAPAEGFGRVIADAGAPRDAFARIARRRLTRLQTWLSMRSVHEPSQTSPVRDVVGTGHGLTPSGDDALIGALALLDALGKRSAHANLARAVDLVPPGLTSPLSHCFLRVAAAGHVGESLHAAVSSIVRGDADAAIAAIGEIGHSSGWDMMAGIVTALDAVTSRNQPVYPSIEVPQSERF